MKNIIKKLNKMAEEKIVAVLFLLIIFSMLIVTISKNYNEIKESINQILQNSERTKYENFIQLTQKSDNILNENLILKSEYVDLYGLVQNVLQKKYIQDSTDRTRDVIKTNENMLTFVQKKENMVIRAKKIADLNKKLEEYNIPLIYIQAPYKVRKSEELPIGINDYANENADTLLFYCFSLILSIFGRGEQR